MEDKMSSSREDYLEAMVMLGATTEDSVRPVDVATKMGVSKASVNKAVSALKDDGYVEQPYYGDITLTQKGYDHGNSVLKRHLMLFTFLTKELGVSEDVANEEACQMEHAISDSSFEKWFDYVERLGLM